MDLRRLQVEVPEAQPAHLRHPCTGAVEELEQCQVTQGKWTPLDGQLRLDHTQERQDLLALLAQ